MGRSIKLNGYFGGDAGFPAPVELIASVSGAGMGETLTLECKGACRVSMPYRPIERLAREAYAECSRQEKNSMEFAVRLDAQDMNRHKAEATAYLRVNGNFLMLSVDFLDTGQISAPFAPIAQMVRDERKTFA